MADRPHRITMRLATDADSPAIGALFHAATLADLGVDWTAPGVGGWWLVAERLGITSRALLEERGRLPADVNR